MHPMGVRWTLAVILGACAVSATSVAACSGKSGSGVPSDASTDTSTFDVVRVDHALVESGGDDSSGDDGGCTPLPVEAGFPFVPPNPPRSVCTVNQIQTMYADCWQGGPVSACNSFYGDPTNSACIACMITDSTASSWGAIINFPNGVGYPNIAGCEALVARDGGGVACAHAIEAAGQ